MRSSLLVSVALLAGCRSEEVWEAHPERGRDLFATYCAACHGSDGLGSEAAIPPLAGSSWVTGPEFRSILTVLHGLRGPIEVNGNNFELEMPGFAPILSDEDVASVLTYVRRRFGKASPVSSGVVRRLRAATRERTEYWTADELRRLFGD